MRTIVFNGAWMGLDTFGVSRFAENVLRELDCILDSKKDSTDIRILAPEGRNLIHYRNLDVVVKGKAGTKLEKNVWEQITFPSYVKKEHATGVDLTLGFPVWGVEYVAVYDCIYESYPENYKGHEMHRKLYLSKVEHLAKKNGIHFITVSHESKKEIQKFYGIKDENISVIGCGWEHMGQIAEDDSIFEQIKIPAGKEYFFSLGSKYRHKNISWVVNAARCNPGYYFVSTGSGSLSDEQGKLMQDMPSNMIFTGYISDSQMKALMQHCRALIQPSLCEGFGIPPLEALSLGKEIIVAKASCLPEIFQGSAHYIDPFDSNVNLDDILKSQTPDVEVVLANYTWKNAAKQLADLLNI